MALGVRKGGVWVKTQMQKAHVHTNGLSHLKSVTTQNKSVLVFSGVVLIGQFFLVHMRKVWTDRTDGMKEHI